MNYLIAGFGPAAVYCAEAIRRRDKTGGITMLSPESELPYSRITLPEYLTGEVAEEGMYFRGKDFLEKNDIRLLGGRSLERLCPAEHLAVLDDGSRLPYDKLLLATGSRPVIPGWMKGELEGVYSLWGRADAERLANAVKPGDKAVVIGGGLVGMQAARALCDHGLRVTVLEAAHRLMPQQLDDAASELLRRAAENAGVRIGVGVRVAEIQEKKGRAFGVKLESGEWIEADHILVCVGVVPNLEMLEGLFPGWERGVEVDDTMRTPLPDIYAAGDVARAPTYPEGRKEVRAIWSNAVEQGAVAGATMAGGSALFEGSRALNSIQLFGLSIASAGVVLPGDNQREAVLSPPATGRYRKVILEGDRLVGALLAGEIRGAGPLFQKLGKPLEHGFLSGIPALHPEHLME